MVSLPQILGIPPLDGNLGAVLLGVILGSMYVPPPPHCWQHAKFRVHVTEKALWPNRTSDV